MARDVTAGMSSNFTSQNVLRPVLFVEMDFPAGISRVNSTPDDVPWNSQTWSGIPNVTEIGDITESSNLIAQRLVLKLSGVPSEQIANAFSSIQGRSAKLWFGLLDANGDVEPDPYMSYDGEMESMNILEEGVRATITLSITNKLINLQKAKESLWTHEEQIRLYPGDLGLEFISEIQNERTIL